MLRNYPKSPSHKNLRHSMRSKPVIGWREWAELPDLGITKIKVKIDTGARTSALHAYDVTAFRKHGKEFVKFKVHPFQRNTKKIVECEAQLREWRHVTDSGGKRTLRPVIFTRLKLGQGVVLVEVTLISRDEMGFRMLVGRQAIIGFWIVDPSKSFIAEDELLMISAGKAQSRKIDEEE